MGNQFFTQPSKTFQRPPTGAGFRLHDRFCFSVKRHEREGNKTMSGKRDRPYIQFHAEGQKPSVFFSPLRGEWKLCLFNLVPISEALNTLKVSICAKRKSWQEHSAFSAPSHLFRRDFMSPTSSARRRSTNSATILQWGDRQRGAKAQRVCKHRAKCTASWRSEAILGSLPYRSLEGKNKRTLSGVFQSIPHSTLSNLRVKGD